MRLFDTHCHLNDAAYQADLAAVLKRARAAGVVRMLVVGYDLPLPSGLWPWLRPKTGIYAAVGIHPHDAAGSDRRRSGTFRRNAGPPESRCAR